MENQGSNLSIWPTFPNTWLLAKKVEKNNPCLLAKSAGIVQCVVGANTVWSVFFQGWHFSSRPRQEGTSREIIVLSIPISTIIESFFSGNTCKKSNCQFSVVKRGEKFSQSKCYRIWNWTEQWTKQKIKFIYLFLMVMVCLQKMVYGRIQCISVLWTLVRMKACKIPLSRITHWTKPKPSLAWGLT